MSFHVIIEAQTSYTLSGKITDGESKEALIGATLQINTSSQGIITNEKGFYRIKLPEGTHLIVISYLGYFSDSVSINLHENIQRDFSLKALAILGDQIIVSSRDPKDNVLGVESGVVKINRKEIRKLPALLGESDFLRVIKLSPGVKSGSDADMGFYVRGGAADQNLVLLDKTTIYNPSHALGIFSVFNSDIIRNTKLIKSGMPANFGGRLSSIVDFNSLNGDLNDCHLEGSIGILSTKLMLQGPILKDKVSFLVAGRRSYLDEVLKPLIKPFVPGSNIFYNHTKYHLADINGKLFYELNRKNRIGLTFYRGRDDYRLENLPSEFENKMTWGNRLGAINWNHQINPEWTIHSTAGLTSYKFTMSASQAGIDIFMNSSIEDVIIRSEVTNAGNNGQIIRFGAEYILHAFEPNNINSIAGEIDVNYGSNKILKANESSVFYNHEFDLVNKLRFNMGLRYTLYSHNGPFVEFKRNSLGEISDTIFFEKGERIRSYHAPEPRISLRYQLNHKSAVKASLTMNSQFVHMVSSGAVTLPTDVWLPSTKKVKPQKATQYSLSYHSNFFENMLQSSVSIYYKNYSNQIELLQGLINNFQDNLFEESMTFGSGNSYGAELFIHKTYGKVNGWFGYTLSWTNRQFKEINLGKIYPAKYDRRHDINFIASYDLSKNLTFSGTFTLSSGNAFTIPEYKYIMEGKIINGYVAKNSFRMPAYHRLDLSLNYLLAKKEKYESSVNISIFNVYNRKNPFYIFFEATGNIYDLNLKITPRQVTILPIIPSISWNFKF